MRTDPSNEISARVILSIANVAAATWLMGQMRSDLPALNPDHAGFAEGLTSEQQRECAVWIFGIDRVQQVERVAGFGKD